MNLFKLPNQKGLTSNDYLEIDYHYETGVKQIFHGNFIDGLSKGHTAFWQFEQTICLIPTACIETDAGYAEYLRDPTQADVYEIRYVHKWRCTYDEIKHLFVEIGNRFIDPQTSLISSTTIFRPVSMSVANQYHGEGRSQHPAKLPDVINFYWDPKHLENWEFLDRPLTSSLPHTSLGI